MSMLLPQKDNCPHCGLNLNGGLIADVVGEEVARSYEGAFWRREIGVEVPEVYDGTLYYRCPECGGEWHRWSESSGFQEKANEHMKLPLDKNE